ncbi:AAA ATPase [Paraburkholderia hospita]|uniref:AAA ATPase n=2 Tax=Paraburkholderia hospita TaxID=169430 RepID=A0ABP2P9S7_9BURK|nr:ATP-binding protein [Paraburkholderia hospita]EIM94451.1 AAA ATPase [Paraburkholderia hospita]OUL73298.1 AAA family ATPase [Paraburkholderia hospita]OUL80590.1 AAA family ATPase [Paraburkholderia hospita]SKD03860.1 AAA+-type ATPase, SpoVK/Ycf46/Vps4 family [Burkholderia sp. CF099]
MRELFRCFFDVLFWVPAALLALDLANSFDVGGASLSVPSSQHLLATTLVAAWAICARHRESWAWTRVAFAVLSLGLLRLLIAFNQYSSYGAIIWGLAFLGVLFQHRRMHRPGNAGNKAAPNVAASAAPVGSQPPHQYPQAPVYNYDHKVQAARYTFDDIIGMADTKRRLLAVAEEIIGGEASNRNGMIAFGDPGNGKSFFAEALAGQLGVPFFSLGYADVASPWINETPMKVKAAFDRARSAGACVFLVDEFDSFVKARDSRSSHAMDVDLTNVMLTEIVALRGSRVVLVAATNFLDKLDRASVREGRFDYKIEVPSPDFEARQAILRKSIGDALGFAAVDGNVVTSLADRWEGFSASRLSKVGEEIKSMRRNGQIGQGKVSFANAMLAMRQMVGRRGKLPEKVLSINEIIMPPQSRGALKDLAFRMKNIASLEKIGGRLPVGLALSGPPGTGKTAAAMALAKASGWAFLKITGADIIADPECWDKLVREAKDIRPVVLFLDEADDILCDRRYSNHGTLTNKLLTTLDGGGGRVRDILYIAATNHYDRIDPAAVRGGRFEEKIVFDVPSADDMRRYATRKLTTMAGTNYRILPATVDTLARTLADRALADADAILQKTIDSAAVRALREQIAEIRPDDVEAAARTVFADHA